MTVTIPIRTVSEANTREHHMARHRRKKAQQKVVSDWLRAFGGEPPPLPVVVTLTRLGARRLDSDNLAGAMKHAQDAIAKWLGVDDGSHLVRWVYEQEPARRVRMLSSAGKPRSRAVYELRVNVELWNEAQGDPMTARRSA